jgi:hypothetical protein
VTPAPLSLLLPPVHRSAADLSPGSADSPFESPVDSPESPYDSPDDHTPDDDTPDDD